MTLINRNITAPRSRVSTPATEDLDVISERKRRRSMITNGTNQSAAKSSTISLAGGYAFDSTTAELINPNGTRSKRPLAA